MTYTYKISRRLAISRRFVTPTALALVAACAGDTTAPEGTGDPHTPSAPTSPTAPLGFRVMPGSITVEVNQQVRFRGELRSAREGVRVPPLRWEATGGTITPDGVFTAGRAGTYRVIGRNRIHRPDTSVVVVVPRQPRVERVRVTPRTPELDPGAKRTFSAVGRLPDGTHTALRVNWSATGGSISTAGVYVAGDEPGTYRVVAKSLRGGLTDTIPVLIRGRSKRHAVATRLVLRPASVTLATTTTQQFAAFGRTETGDSVAVDVSFEATGGSITETGLYTAGPTAGSFRIIARADQLSDTSVVTVAQTSGGGTPAPAPDPSPLPDPTPEPSGTGIPMSLSALLASGREPMAYTASLDSYTASNIVARLATARQKKLRVLMNMTGGSHDQYKTDGVFDYSKWKAKMDSYNTPTIRAAVAAAIADGTIIGNSVMDEPANHTPKNSWGPVGTMTKERVDGMCKYVQDMFPGLPVGVVHDHRLLDPTKNYQHCDFLLSQYRMAKGDVREFRDGGLAFARQSGIAIAFSLNVIHGGEPGTDCEKWGDDPNGVLCPMTAEQVRSWGVTLGSAGCALNMWRYEQAYFDKPEIQRALYELAGSLAKLPAKSCRRP